MIVIQDAAGTRTIDDEPVRVFIQAVEAGDTVRVVELSNALDREQLRLAVVELASMYTSKKRMVDWGMTEKGVAASQMLIDLAKSARAEGTTLWPELLNGDA